MSVRFLIVANDVVENVVVAESATCLAEISEAVLQGDELAHVCLGWRFVDGHFVDPYADPGVTA